MTARQALLAAALGFTVAAPAAAQTANDTATSPSTVIQQPGAMGSGAPGGNPAAAGGPSPQTQGVPDPNSAGATLPQIMRQTQENQLGVQNQGGTQGITVQPGAANQPGTVVEPGRQAQQSGPGQTGARERDVNPAPNGAATGATTPTQPTQGGNQGGTGQRSDTTPPAATTQHTQPRTAAAPVAGANSFTEAQARARMADAGFNDVQELQLDNQGIWRARGIRNGQPSNVALDFQGNVTATQ
ncbi:MAG TPA: hypothetical protein VE033_10900 [Acetobacteraceae bacterium]|jgi:hypothetical protein|nr:hypothetical protein [Acetobacteraceae bacterium]